MQAEAMNDTTIAVTWLPPSSVRQNGRIIGYKVYYSDWPNCRKGLNEKLEEFTVDGANARVSVYYYCEEELKISIIISIDIEFPF